ncbi:MAG: DUF3575 domain-containing protein [Duncaniella sp.]|nr:DUF3575 domain-containing protein [Duncaniella sp.]
MRLIAFALAVMVTIVSFADNHADSVTVSFRVGHRNFDPSFDDNAHKMESFISQAREALSAGKLKSVVVSGFASPDGGHKANERLAHARCKAIADYIVANTDISPALIEEKNGGIDWTELRRLVAETPGVPAREKIIQIIDNTPIWVFGRGGVIVSGRKKQLMDLQGGRPYNWMLANLFPKMRNAVAVTLCMKEESAVPPVAPVQEALPQAVVIPAEQPEAVEEQPVFTEVEEVAVEEIVPPAEPSYDSSRHHFALKTNLLYDAALMPNLELEWFINDKWSVSLEGDVAWWKFRFDKIYRLAMISPEVRYHIHPKAPWHGMYVGAFVGGGLYQLENGGDGYHGEGGMAGASVGYMWPIGKHLSFDAELGVGYLYTRYKVYRNRDDHKLYLHTKSLNYFGPLKLKFSFVWRFDMFAKRSANVSSTL